MRQLPPSSVWIDHRLTLGPSAIEGCGLFFAEPLPAGTVVVRLGGRLVNSSDLESLIADPAGGYIDTITVYDDVHLVLPSGSLAHYGNHSCDPTLWHTGPYELATRRDVGAGEEATIDYATQSGPGAQHGVLLRVAGMPGSGDQQRLAAHGPAAALPRPLGTSTPTENRSAMTDPS